MLKKCIDFIKWIYKQMSDLENFCLFIIISVCFYLFIPGSLFLYNVLGSKNALITYNVLSNLFNHLYVLFFLITLSMTLYISYYKERVINWLKWLVQELKNWHTIVLFILVCIVMYSPVYVGYLIHLIFGWSIGSVIATSYLLFWAGPFTPFFPMCIAITLFLRKLIERKEEHDDK